MNQIMGQLRANYVDRPIVPLYNEIPKEVNIEQPIDNESIYEFKKVDEPKSKTIDIQTDFRDNEAQTDPFSREIIKKGNDPEVLRIKNLVWG